MIVAKDIEARERLKKKLETAIANGALPQARARVDRFNFGPPVGFPVQFRVIGPDPAKVRAIAYQVRDVMRGDEGVDDPHLHWNEQTPIVRLVIDQDRARLMGLTPQDVSNRLRHGDLRRHRRPPCATASTRSTSWRAPSRQERGDLGAARRHGDLFARRQGGDRLADRQDRL